MIPANEILQREPRYKLSCNIKAPQLTKLEKWGACIGLFEFSEFLKTGF
jgi:hypothetical protein